MTQPYIYDPKNVNTRKCDHEAKPPVCKCVHDWRVYWGNLKRVGG